MILNEAIYNKLSNWINVPFRFKQYSKAGCDCVGLLVGILYEIDENHGFIKDYHLHKQGNYINGKILVEALAKYASELKLSEAQKGDIALFTLARNQTNHLGIISSVDPLYMIHTDRSVKKVVENSIDEYWKDKLRIIFRLN